jgi:tetratricopeptide (TPR) repeat protein
VLGRAPEALPYYEKAVALGLPANELSGALIGLGATLRTLGQLDRSAAVLRSGQLQFPDNPEFAAFLALTLHAQGQSAAALRLALETLCETTEDPGLTAYQRAIRHAAGRL